MVRALIAGIFDELKPMNVTTNVAGLRQQRRVLNDRIANLTAAVEDGAALAPIVAKRHARQAEREDLLKAIAAADAAETLQVDRQTVERTVLSQIDKWRQLLAADGRQVLREALVGPLRCRPVAREYHFDGRTATGKIIADSVGDVSYLLSVPNARQLEPPRALAPSYRSAQAERLTRAEAFFWRGARLGDARTTPSGFWSSC